ncbi:MAG: S1C family serine protease, partial [Actinomycetota bacterium]
ASDSDGTNAQTIDGLIQLAANIQPGDSGGPVVRTDGTVVGMTVAASASNSFGFLGDTGGEGYAIAIEDAMAIARKIISKEGGPDIRVGATRGVLGVQIQPQLTNRRSPGGSGSTGGSGARVLGVEPGSGADKAGLVEGSVIIGIEGKTVATTNDLTATLVPYGPGEVVELVWREPSGETRRATVKLGEGPPA